MSNYTPIEVFLDKHDRAERSELSSLIISDPESQTDLVNKIESGEIPVRYLNRYKTKEKVRCAFCDQRQAHHFGYTAVMEDGRLALCGRNCGHKYFGEDALRMERILTSAINLAAATEIKRRCFECLPDLIRDIEAVWLPLDWEARQVVGKIPTMRKSLLTAHMTVDGDLEVVGRGDQYGKRIGLVKCAYLLEKPRAAFDVVVSEARAILEKRDRYGRAISDESILKKARALPKQIETACVELAGLRKFLSHENVAALRKALSLYYAGSAQIKRQKRDGYSVMRVKHGHLEWKNYRIPDLSKLPKAELLVPDIIPTGV